VGSEDMISVRRVFRLVLAPILLAVIPGTGALGDSKPVTASSSGNAFISCVCVLATSGCPLKRFDELAGSPRQSWVQPAAVLEGHTYDVSLLCYRQRDVQGRGEGLCCQLDGDEKDVRYFSGSLGRIE